MKDNRQKATADAASGVDRKCIAAIAQELDQSCQTMDGYTLSRLNGIRHAALAKRQLKRRGALRLPFGGLATAAVLVLSISVLDMGSWSATENATGSTPLEDIDILTSSDSLDLFEDYEFYQWLVENESSV